MTQKLIYDQHGDIKRVVHWDADQGFFGDFAIELIQNLDPLLEQNKRLREQSQKGQATKQTFTLMGSVPAFIIEKADREQWDAKDWDRFFNDPDNAVFKTYWGRV